MVWKVNIHFSSSHKIPIQSFNEKVMSHLQILVILPKSVRKMAEDIHTLKAITDCQILFLMLILKQNIVLMLIYIQDFTSFR